MNRFGLGVGLIPTAARAIATTAPVNVVPPSITGIPTQGQTVSASPGSWLGLPSGVYAYQWQRNGTNISGATASTYVLAGPDVGQDITVEVTATNDLGSTMAESTAIVPAATLTLTGTPPDGTVGAAYTFTPSSTGGRGTKSYALTGTLQSGLSFNTSTGAITGTPSASGTASGLNITVTDADGLTASLGVFDIFISVGGISAEDYPTTIAAAFDTRTHGDSTMAGVASETGYAPYQCLAAKLTAGSVTNRSAGGMSFTTGASPINGQVTGQGATPLQTNFQHITGGLNQYLTSVNPDPGAQTWLEAVKTAINGTIEPSFTTGQSRGRWTYWVGIAEDVSGPGMRYWADWWKLTNDLTAIHGAHVFDIRRYMMWKGLPVDTNDLDFIFVDELWSLPLNFRGIGTGAGADLAYPNTARTTMNTTSTATTTPAGIEAVAPASLYPTGAAIQNINAAAVTGDNIYIKTGTGNWQREDEKHLSRWANECWADAKVRQMDAMQGGCPNPAPGRLFIKQDDVASTAAGTLYYAGTGAPVSASLFNLGGTAVSQFSLSIGSPSGGSGAIAVTRSGAGTLTEGHHQFIIELKNAAGKVKHDIVDCYVLEPSTQTTPRLWELPYSTGANSALSSASIGGGEVNGLSDGATVWVAGWMKPYNIALSPYLFNFGARSGSGSFNVNISSSGGMRFVSANAAGANLLNNTAASVFADNTETWFAAEFSSAGGTVTGTGYYNKGGAGDIAMSFGTMLTGGSNFPLAKLVPRFLALRDATYADRWWSTPDAGRNQFRGAIGNLLIGVGAPGFATESVRRALWNTDGTPAARVPYSAVGGATPTYDVRGGPGEFACGGHNQAQPWFLTRRAAKGLVAV